MELLGYFNMLNQRRGQSLIEALIALAVGGMLVGTAATLMAVVLRVSSQNVFLRAAAALNEGLLEQVTSYAERKWFCPGIPPTGCGLYNLSKGPTNEYRLVPVSPPSPPRLDSQSGRETIVLEGVRYERWFYVQNLCRSDTSGNITGITDNSGAGNTCTPGESEDPSTQRVVAVTEWNEGGVVRSIPLARYVSRNRSVVFRQTGWEGGSTTPTLLISSVPNTQFFEANGVDYRRVPGTFILTNIPIWP